MTVLQPQPFHDAPMTHTRQLPEQTKKQQASPGPPIGPRLAVASRLPAAKTPPYHSAPASNQASLFRFLGLLRNIPKSDLAVSFPIQNEGEIQ